MSGWPLVRVDELCELRPQKSEARGRLKPSDSVSFVPMNDLPVDRMWFSANEARLLSDVEGSYTYFADGDVLMAKITPCFENGKLGIARNLKNGAGFGSSEFFVLRPSGRLLAEYLYYFLSRSDYRERGASVMTGAVGHRRVPKEFVEGTLIPLPPLAEQKRIVAILDEAFEGIAKATANAERNLASARELFETRRDGIFERSGEGWLEGALGEFVTIKHGFAFKSEYFTDAGNHVLLTPGNFFERGGYRDRGAKQKYYVGPIPHGFLLAGGSLLVAMTEQAPGLLGSPMIVPDNGHFLHNQRLGLVEPRSNVPWVPELFEHLFNTRRFRNQVHKDGTGVKVRHTSPEKLRSVIVRIPATASEQRLVSDALTEIEMTCGELESVLRRRIQLGVELRSTLLQRAFSGLLTGKEAIAA